ncbi:MAG: anti-sigma factor [Geodermatophilaceae bacterium]|nr:anti-sigma factor [Geodermatophilaceae bacterium]
MSRDGSGRRDHEEYDELAVGWALKALEPDDESRFAKHQPDCPRCVQTVREAQEMTAAMAMAVPMEEPSEALRARILAAVEAEPREADLRPQVQVTRRPPLAVGAQRRPARHQHRSRDRIRRVARGAALAAALALVVGLGVWNVGLREDRSAAQAVAVRQAEVLEQLNDGGIYHIAPLQTSDGEAVGMVVVHDGAAQVMSNGLPVNDAEREILVLWGIRDSLSPVPLGTFDVLRSELDVRTVSSTSTGLEQYDGYAISLEPGRQAPSAPTESAMVATGTVGS